MAELADAADSKSADCKGLEGSTPSIPTKVLSMAPWSNWLEAFASKAKGSGFESRWSYQVVVQLVQCDRGEMADAPD